VCVRYHLFSCPGADPSSQDRSTPDIAKLIEHRCHVCASENEAAGKTNSPATSLTLMPLRVSVLDNHFDATVLLPSARRGVIRDRLVLAFS
jgi:hypothetical protein